MISPPPSDGSASLLGLLRCWLSGGSDGIYSVGFGVLESMGRGERGRFTLVGSVVVGALLVVGECCCTKTTWVYDCN